MTLLNKELKYNLHSKKDDWIKKNLALEAETAIDRLPEPDRDYCRWQTANRIHALYTTKRVILTSDWKAKTELKTLKNIKAKLKEN